MIAELKAEGIKAVIEPHGGIFRAALHGRDGHLRVENLTCESHDSAQAWLQVQVETLHPNSRTVRGLIWSGKHSDNDSSNSRGA